MHPPGSKTRIVLFSAVVSIAVMSAPAANQAQEFADPLIDASIWASGLSFPVAFAFLPNASGNSLDVLINEKYTGRVQHFRDGMFQSTVLDLNVSGWGEQGLLGMALHPDFANNGFTYLYYSLSPTLQDENDPAIPAFENRVSRFVWDGTSLGQEQVLLRLPTTAAFHIGGVLTFGPDDKLYGIIGNVGHFGQLQNIATGAVPDTTSIVFRLEDDGSIPADNPFVGMGGAMQYTYGYGVRNSYGIEFDPISAVLWESENGPDQYDELNRFEEKFNGGFARILGPESRSPATLNDLWHAPGSVYTDPQLSWLTPIAVAAIHFLNSDSLGTHYRNDLFVGGFNTQSLYHFELKPDRSGLVLPGVALEDSVADDDVERDASLWGWGFGGGVVWLDTGPDGALYALTWENGLLYRLARSPVSDVPGDESGYHVQLFTEPNPFHGETRLRLTPQPESRQTLRIYTVRGQLVRSLVGRGEFVWDGRDAGGRLVPTGVYVARIGQDGSSRHYERKIVRLRQP